MLSPKAKRYFLQILPFGLIWFVFSLMYSLLEKGLLGDLLIYPATGNNYDFYKNILITPPFAMATGLLLGTLEVSYFKNLFKSKTILQKVSLKIFVYLGVVICFLLALTIFVNYLELKTDLLDQRLWDQVLSFFTNFAFWSVVLFISVIIGICLFYNEVSNNLGFGVLKNFITGKYHRPIEEKRIFMFLDMKGSTTIAENIGHVKYFELLKDYYADLSDSVVEYGGEIYQYVGDEMVLTWSIKNGVRKNNCLKCFFSMKTALQSQSEKYHTKFGVIPTFKAGFHFGEVTSGEIGEIKKDIIHTGDVINTSARIQGLCNSYKVDILLSGVMMSLLNLNGEYKSQRLGESDLRGRDQKIELHTIQEN
ncbi:MAG: adenylate/guanylate cyclase domain-containing protein [Saprospiraceae bacterium]|nr:adenylate/guanylate cyclase domain-containing protein [Saprospiraceae bacterium]